MAGGVSPTSESTFNTMSLLSGALAGQKQHAAAEPLLLQGFEGMKQRAGKIPRNAKPRLGEAADRLVAFYEARGNAAEAAKWREERQALAEQSAATEAAKKK